MGDRTKTERKLEIRKVADRYIVKEYRLMWADDFLDLLEADPGGGDAAYYTERLEDVERDGEQWEYVGCRKSEGSPTLTVEERALYTRAQYHAVEEGESVTIYIEEEYRGDSD